MVTVRSNHGSGRWSAGGPAPHLSSCWDQNYGRIASYRRPYTILFNSSPLEKNGCHFADNIFVCIFMNEVEYSTLTGELCEYVGQKCHIRRFACTLTLIRAISLIATFMGPTWGPSGADRTQVGPMLAPWTLLSGIVLQPSTPYLLANKATASSDATSPSIPGTEIKFPLWLTYWDWVMHIWFSELGQHIFR